ncbi:hypothetical protein [Leporid alphaherpesvirus 4]|uniref:Uncharacterized protein n=1 Tax=Leporid alphaherpesvirus 4 TaxID=481315 RepID=J9QQR5_9ALPH|nr:hypothetical protein [Leporid alphaherpesvirus 4]AFR32441.1 hypothetical protein [Leporid alphaherpesvirus 4]
MPRPNEDGPVSNEDGPVSWKAPLVGCCLYGKHTRQSARKQFIGVCYLGKWFVVANTYITTPTVIHATQIQ